MVKLYYLCIFLSQFNYILTFNFAGVYINPIKISLFLLVLVDIVHEGGMLKIYPEKKCEWFSTLILWNIWTVLSLVWAQSKVDVIKSEIIFFEALLLVYYGLKLIKTKEHYTKVMDCLFVALAIHNILCWIELRYKVYFFSIYVEKYTRLGYPVSTFTNTNNLGFYLSLMIILLLMTIMTTKSKMRRVVCSVLMASSLFINIRTGSRGAIICLVIGLIIYVLLIIKNKKAAIGTAFVFIAAMIFLTNNESVAMYANQIIDKAFEIDTNAVKGSDFYRMNAYANGWDFYVESVGVGIGPGNCEYWMENYGKRFTNNIPNLHNWWLEILVCSGTVVAVCVLRAWIKSYTRLWKNYSRENYKGANARWIITCGTMAFGVVFAIGCIAPSSLFATEWSWTMLAVLFLTERWLREDSDVIS